MKFSDYFHARGIRSIAAFLGIMAGSGISVFTNWQYGVLSGALIAFFASFILPWMLYRRDLPYLRIKEKMETPFLLDERVRFTVRGGTVDGFLILTQKSMVFLSLESGDHRLELSRNDVKSVKLGENMTISIFLNNTQFIRVIAGDCEGICNVLRENGWTVAD